MSLLVILDEVLKYIHEEKLREIPLPNPKGLSYKLKRGETSLKTRWQYYLKPMILQYYTNTMFISIRNVGIELCISRVKLFGWTLQPISSRLELNSGSKGTN